MDDLQTMTIRIGGIEYEVQGRLELSITPQDGVEWAPRCGEIAAASVPPGPMGRLLKWRPPATSEAS